MSDGPGNRGRRRSDPVQVAEHDAGPPHVGIDGLDVPIDYDALPAPVRDAISEFDAQTRMGVINPPSDDDASREGFRLFYTSRDSRMQECIRLLMQDGYLWEIDEHCRDVYPNWEQAGCAGLLTDIRVPSEQMQERYIAHQVQKIRANPMAHIEAPVLAASADAFQMIRDRLADTGEEGLLRDAVRRGYSAGLAEGLDYHSFWQDVGVGDWIEDLRSVSEESGAVPFDPATHVEVPYRDRLEAIRSEAVADAVQGVRTTIEQIRAGVHPGFLTYTPIELHELREYHEGKTEGGVELQCADFFDPDKYPSEEAVHYGDSLVLMRIPTMARLHEVTSTFDEGPEYSQYMLRAADTVLRAFGPLCDRFNTKTVFAFANTYSAHRSDDLVYVNRGDFGSSLERTDSESGEVYHDTFVRMMNVYRVAGAMIHELLHAIQQRLYAAIESHGLSADRESGHSYWHDLCAAYFQCPEAVEMYYGQGNAQVDRSIECLRALDQAYGMQAMREELRPVINQFDRALMPRMQESGAWSVDSIGVSQAANIGIGGLLQSGGMEHVQYEQDLQAALPSCTDALHRKMIQDQLLLIKHSDEQ